MSAFSLPPMLAASAVAAMPACQLLACARRLLQAAPDHLQRGRAQAARLLAHSPPPFFCPATHRARACLRCLRACICCAHRQTTCPRPRPPSAPSPRSSSPSTRHRQRSRGLPRVPRPRPRQQRRRRRRPSLSPRRRSRRSRCVDAHTLHARALHARTLHARPPCARPPCAFALACLRSRVHPRSRMCPRPALSIKPRGRPRPRPRLTLSLFSYVLARP